MYKMLLDEPPLVVLPSLAVLVGLNEAIVLQQVHYWLVNAREAKRVDNFKEGRWWVYNSYSEWAKTFPFWSEITIERTFLDLEKRGLLISAHLSKASTDRTKWYSINYDSYRKLVETPESLPSDQIDTVDSINLIQCNVSKRSDASVQNDPMQQPKKIRSIKDSETTSETTTKTTADTGSRFNKRTASTVLDRSVAASLEDIKSQDSDSDPVESRLREIASGDFLALVSDLVDAGVNRADALRLAKSDPDECHRQLAYLPFVPEFKSSKGAYLRSAIEDGYAAPTGFVQAQELKQRQEADAARTRQAEEKQKQSAADQETRRLEVQFTRERIERDNPAAFAALIEEARSLLPPPLRGKTEHRSYLPTLNRNIENLILERKL